MIPRRAATAIALLLLPLAVLLPQAQAQPAAPQLQEPGACWTMTNMGADDRVVPWPAIKFDPGVIQRNWRLQSEARNDGEQTWFATLHRETHPWNVNETKTWPRIVDEDGERVEATHVGSRVPDFFRLVHEFSFATHPGDGRSWGMIPVTVDDQPWRVGIPSSLFKHHHATPGRRHARALPLRAQQ